MTSPSLPTDVAIARSVRAHARALVAMSAVCVLLALVAAGGLSMAGPGGRDVLVVAALTLLAAGQLLAIAGAVVAGLGLAAVLRGVGEPGSGDSVSAVRRDLPGAVLARTSRRLAVLMRVVVATAVLGVTLWAVLAPAGTVGAVVGALVTVQVAVVVAIVRVKVLHAALRAPQPGG